MLSGHYVYDGHFPGNPITPGVLTLAIVRECAEEFIGHNLKYTYIKNCRFVAMIRPCERLTLNIDISTTEFGHTVRANITTKDGNCRLQLEANF